MRATQSSELGARSGSVSNVWCCGRVIIQDEDYDADLCISMKHIDHNSSEIKAGTKIQNSLVNADLALLPSLTLQVAMFRKGRECMALEHVLLIKIWIAFSIHDLDRSRFFSIIHYLLQTRPTFLVNTLLPNTCHKCRAPRAASALSARCNGRLRVRP
jgi:hypothetical protein